MDPNSWRRFGRTPASGNCRTIFWHRFGEPLDIKPVYCPAELATGVIEYVRRTYGQEPKEVLPSRELYLDTGGMSCGRAEGTLLLAYPGRRIRLSANLSQVPRLLSWAAEGHSPRSYGMCWPGNLGRTILPPACTGQVLRWLAGLLPEGQDAQERGLARLAGNEHILLPRGARIAEA